jgi:AAA+ ATPase superfamily predicted ATPase
MDKNLKQIRNPFKFGKIVKDDDFCNRSVELKTLKKHIRDGYSVWLFSPRRFGKTSLLMKAFEEVEDVRCLYLDLYNIRSMDDFCRKYARVIAHGLFDWKEDVKNLSAKLAGFFKNMYPAISFDQYGTPSFSLQVPSIEKQQEIEDLLNIPEKLAQKHDLKICIAFDEFQETERIHKFMIHWMRSSFQQHQNVSYIFMGSKPSLMKSIFTSKNSPFYEFAIKMEIDKIKETEFTQFIKNKFEEMDLVIEEQTIQQILEVSGGHPHFTQYFASAVFDLTRDGEDQNDGTFREKWVELVLNSQSITFQNIYDQLNSNQRKALTAISLSEAGNAIFSVETGKKFGLPGSSTLSITLKSLAKKDLIEKEKKAYKIINPVFKLWIQQLTKE